MALNARSIVIAVAAASAALLAFSGAVSAHLRAACVEMDTPYLPLCPELPTDRASVEKRLRERIERNPGDSWAWTKLLASEADQPAKGVLEAATLLAPNNHNVARWRAVQAIRQGEVDRGVGLLVQILRNRVSQDSARIVAQVARTNEGVALLRPHLGDAGKWLPQVLLASYEMKIPAAQILPVVAEAVDQGALPERARQLYMQRLKHDGYWLDAYGLWLAQHKEMIPLLYNGGFDQPIEPEGFDWEFNAGPRSRTGVIVEQEAVARRGLVLGIDFTGRSFAAPVVRQYVFAPPGGYKLRGEYMASKLRSEGGLAWTVACTAGAKPVIARSAALQDTGGVWRPLEMEFTIPADCGVVASVQLAPALPYEATTGMRGHVAFDGFSLTRSAVSP